MKKLLQIAALSVGICLGVPLLFQITAILNPEVPAVPWHVELRVSDKSGNPLENAKLTVHTKGNAIAPGVNFFRIPDAESQFDTNTDQNGKLVLNLRASIVWVDIVKSGFEDGRAVFQSRPGCFGNSYSEKIHVVLVPKTAE